MSYRKEKEDAATLHGRIKMGMAALGIKNPAELARKMKIHRQTAYKWCKGEVTELTPEMLFLLADALNVNARWLALGPPHSPVKPVSPHPDLLELIQIRRALDDAKPGLGDKWVSDGRELVRIVSPRGVANPFPEKVK